MKNVFFAFALLLTLGLTSCDKEKTCTCTTKTTMDGEVMGEDIVTTVDTKEDCSDLNTSATTMGVTATMTCK